jgi:hypothetical protein
MEAGKRNKREDASQSLEFARVSQSITSQPAAKHAVKGGILSDL